MLSGWRHSPSPGPQLGNLRPPSVPPFQPRRRDYGAEGGVDRLLVSAQKPRPPRPESTAGSPALPCGERRPGRVNTRPAPLSRERFLPWFVDSPTGRLGYPGPELRPALAHVGCSSGGRAGLQGSDPPLRSPEL